MAGRSKLQDIKFIAERLREMSPGLVDEFKAILRHPRSLSARLEERSPWLGRRFLGAASNFTEPFLAGMGLKVERLEEELVEVSMPDWWRNHGERGFVHTGALAALGEFASRLYWEHHLDLRRSEVNVKALSLRVLARVKGDLRAIYRCSTAEREAVLHRLRAAREAAIEGHVVIYDLQGRMMAEAEIEWHLERALELGPGRAGGDASGADVGTEAKDED